MRQTGRMRANVPQNEGFATAGAIEARRCGEGQGRRDSGSCGHKGAGLQGGGVAAGKTQTGFDSRK
jgi:hypothetical protein